jgi:hypothetical protein
MGGIWFLVNAPSHGAAQEAYPEFIVFNPRPDWMSDSQEAEFRESILSKQYVCDAGAPPPSWLAPFIEEARRG